MALKIKGHHILFTQELKDAIFSSDGKFKSGSIRAQEFGRYETFSKTWQRHLFPGATNYSAASVFGAALVYDVSRTAPSSLTELQMSWEGFKPTPSPTDFIAGWLPEANFDEDQYVRRTIDKAVSCIVFSFRFKMLPITATMPPMLKDLPRLWQRNYVHKPEHLDRGCVCCGELVVDDADLEEDQHPSNFCGDTTVS